MYGKAQNFIIHMLLQKTKMKYFKANSGAVAFQGG